jgi:hypothetical protein
MNAPNRSFQGPGIVAAAIVAAALIVSWALPDGPRYQLAGSGSAVFRMDTDSGEVIGCDMQQCRRVQAPDRAKTLGAISLQLGGSKDKPAIPPPALPKPSD